MSPTHSPDHQLPLPSNEADGMRQALPAGDSSSGQQPMYNSPADCGVGAPSPNHIQFSSMYESPPSFVSGEHQQTCMGYQDRQTGMIQGEHHGQAMPMMQNMQGAPSFYSPSYLAAVDAGPQYPSGFPQFGQAGCFAPQEAAGMPQISTMILPYNGRARTSTSTRDHTESKWTDAHAEVLRQGKQAGKSVPDIIKDLYQIDGVERTPNQVSKRWARMRENCVKKHDMDSIVHAVCPEMVRMLFGELSNLNVAGMPNFGVHLAAAERQAKSIMGKHVAKGVKEVRFEYLQQGSVALRVRATLPIGIHA
ncbi:hypothetical protein NEUTE1DRAFT_148360 [Neurospora tetrasperma FGSC 2508]|uniref:Uncharacterized protein n=1 Tax=Neurospora tetrasperma (strain FGSC 2508 / ATCC MYA-4615 / P0657) TaxID=510951 RepID=F8MT04_NEUT8